MSKMRISLIPRLVYCTVLITPLMLPTRAAMPPTIHFLTTFHRFFITQFHLLSNFYQQSTPTSIFAHTHIQLSETFEFFRVVSKFFSFPKFFFFNIGFLHVHMCSFFFCLGLRGLGPKGGVLSRLVTGSRSHHTFVTL